MPRLRSTITLLAAASAFACVSSQGASTGASAGAATTATAKPGPNAAISADEIAAANVPDAYEAVSRLRQAWFRDRATGAAPVVYLGNQKQGGLEALRAIKSHEVAEIQHYASSVATARWGLEAQSGAIVVILK